MADGPAEELSGYPFRITTRQQDGAVVHQVTGEVDSVTSPRLRATLLGDPSTGDPVVLDLTAVSFLSSAGLAVMIEEYERRERQGVTFSIVAPSGAALRIIEITAVHEVIPVYATVAEAVQAR